MLSEINIYFYSEFVCTAVIEEGIKYGIDPLNGGKKAYAFLLFLLHDTVLVAMLSEVTLHRIWKKLKITYVKTSAVKQVIAR